MTTNETVKMTNKERFIALVKSINRKGFKKDAFLEALEDSDFYTAPASIFDYYSYNRAGGLLDHSLAVYDYLSEILNTMPLPFVYSEDTIKIVSLFHDVSKINYFEPSVKNIKVYSETGTKYDELGRFEWKSERSYKVKDNVFRIGTSGETSVAILHNYLPLTMEETCAIANHEGLYGNPKLSWTQIIRTYPLTQFIESAHSISTLVLEPNADAIEYYISLDKDKEDAKSLENEDTEETNDE